MKLVTKLERLKACISLDLNLDDSDMSITLLKGIVLIDRPTIIKNEMENFWYKKYILEKGLDGIALKDKILEADAIKNFETYYKSKKGIKKFNL